MMLQTTLRLVLGTALFATPVFGQIDPGRIFEGGEQVSDPSAGLTMTIPAGWRGALAQDATSFVLEAANGGGYIIVAADEMAESEARRQLSAVVDLGDGVLLTPRGAVQQIGAGHLSAAFGVSGAGANLEAAIDVRLTGNGVGLAFILLSPPDQVTGDIRTLRELSSSLVAAEPAEPAESVAAAADGDEWEPFLRGEYLARFFTRTGYTESTELWLCSNGDFYFNDQLGGFGGGASGAFQGLGNGRWSATGAGATGTLRLQWSDGRESVWDLEYDYDQGRVFVNGERMLRGENERCG